MTQRNRNPVGSHDVQQHVRYVEVYTIDDPEVEDQPVQVKALKWGGAGYGMYGDPFRVGDVALAAAVTTGDKFWITWRRDSQRWERLTGGTGSNTPPLREFALQATKNLADTTASVKWLDHTQAEVGSALNIYDPDHRFSGKAASYVGFEVAFRGLALLRTDLAAETADRWEIIAMERFAEFIVVKKYAPSTYHYVSSMSSDDDWYQRPPAAVDTAITLADPGAILGTVATDQKIVARLSDPDTSPPTYNAVSTKITSGGSLRFCIPLSAIPGATLNVDDLEAGSGTASFIGGDPDSGVLDLSAGGSETVYNYYMEPIPSGVPCWAMGSVIVNAGCLAIGYEG